MLFRVSALALLALTSVGSSAAVAQSDPARATAANWRSVATRADRGRIRAWRSSWIEALAQGRGNGQGPEIAAQGPLLNPDAGLPDGAAVPPGNYRCRTIKLGTRRTGMPTYAAYPASRCRVVAPAAGPMRFIELTGTQRVVGHLYPDTARRMVFLGSVELGDERDALRYGSDQERNAPAIVERIGPRQWRLVFPRPSFESIIDVMELVPEG